MNRIDFIATDRYDPARPHEKPRVDVFPSHFPLFKELLKDSENSPSQRSMRSSPSSSESNSSKFKWLISKLPIQIRLPLHVIRKGYECAKLKKEQPQSEARQYHEYQFTKQIYESLSNESRDLMEAVDATLNHSDIEIDIETLTEHLNMSIEEFNRVKKLPHELQEIYIIESRNPEG